MKLYMIIIFLLLSSSFFAQSKEFEHGVSLEGNYLIKEEFKKPYTSQKIRSYLEKEGYIIIKIKSEKFAQFGNVMERVTYVKYITPDGLTKQKERIKYANEQSAKAAVVLIGMTGKLVENTVKSIRENVDASNEQRYDLGNIEVECVHQEKLEYENTNLFEDENGNLIKGDIWKLECSNGTNKYYYYIQKDIYRGVFNGGWEKKGYHSYNNDAISFVSRTGPRIGTNKKEATKALCNCQ